MLQKLLLSTILFYAPLFNILHAQDTPEATDLKIGIHGSFKTVTLGMTREEVLGELQKDSDLELDENTEFGFFDQEQKHIIKAKRHPFLQNVYYQFTQLKEDGAWILYAILVSFNEKHHDYTQLYKMLVEKYGEADRRTAEFSIWAPKGRLLYETKDSRKVPVELILNPPSRIKIIDRSLYPDHTNPRPLKHTPQSYQKEVQKRLLQDFSLQEAS